MNKSVNNPEYFFTEQLIRGCHLVAVMGGAAVTSPFPLRPLKVFKTELGRCVRVDVPSRTACTTWATAASRGEISGKRQDCGDERENHPKKTSSLS